MDLLLQHSCGCCFLGFTGRCIVGRHLHGSSRDPLDVANLESAPVVMVLAGSALAVALAAHTAYNLKELRDPMFSGVEITESISILIPARNEESTIAQAVKTACDQQGLKDFEVIVLDDDSTDKTAEIVNQLAHNDSRIQLIRSGEQLPPGWMGKQFACHRLSRVARGSILVFIDADVELAPSAVAACIQLLRKENLALVAPYPQQQAVGILEKLVQPLVVWSWVATLPVGIAEQSLRPSLSAANGQFLILDTEAYLQAGGHVSVRNIVLEDIALMRSLKKSGARCATVNGAHIAQCRMYESTKDVVDGYTKSLWSAFGSPGGTIAVTALLAATYIAPAVGMVVSRKKSTRAIGAIGYSAGVLSRALVAQRTGNPVFPDSLAHPASITMFIGLTALSWSRHLRGKNEWKGRTL